MVGSVPRLPAYPRMRKIFNTGRETFLAPVNWKDGWPTIIPHGQEVARRYPYPHPQAAAKGELHYSGDIEYTDNFSSNALNLNWEFLRAPRDKWYTLSDRPGWIAVRLRPETVSGRMNPSFIGRRQQQAYSSASTLLEFAPGGDNEKAGLIVFQNENHFYYLCKSVKTGVQSSSCTDQPRMRIPMTVCN